MKKLKQEEILKGIEDTRRSNSVMYPLQEVLFIMLIAIICGATSYVKIEIFSKSRKEWFAKYLKLENGIPDALTYRRILMLITPSKMHEIFAEWMKTVISNLKGVAIPKLLEMLKISECIVTIDAMGTQKDIARKIREKEADYILVLKENQGNLYRDVKMFMDEYCKNVDAKNGDIYSYSLNNEHGRFEKRECYICEEISWLDGREKWTDLNGTGMIVATIEKNGIRSEQRHYFIYSCKKMTAKQIMNAKRVHWSIENSLHWVLDLSFREDESRARKGDSAENFNILRQIAYNILKSDTSIKDSFPNKQFRCLLDSSYLDHIVNSWFCS